MAGVASWVNASLATPQATAVDEWLRAVYSGAATQYDKAMDWGYISSDSLLQHVGGGYHRLFDGGHSVLGWAKAVWNAPTDDGLFERLVGGGKAYWKDLVTPNGMPVVTWDYETFKHFSGALQTHLHVSNAWVYDMLTFTATEAAGGVSAIAAILLNLRRTDPDRYFELCGSLGISAAAAANPITAAVCLALMMATAYKARGTGLKWRHGFAVAKGAIVPLAMIGVTTVIAGPLGLVVGFAVSFGLRWAINRLAVREAVAAYIREVRRSIELPVAPELRALTTS